MSISMSRRVRSAALSATAVLAIAAFGTAAHAADVPAADAAEAVATDDGLNDIVVTAEKRPASLQTTPIAISVLNGDQIANRHVQSLLDLGDGAIPSLRVAPFFSRGSALVMNIRGIGVLSDSNQPARDQGVGVYIDGVYLGRAQGLGSAIYDVEAIEVLKGPQGTLFGRNTEGGAVSIVTRKPSGEFKLRALAGVGNYGSHKGELHLDLPKFHDLSLKFDALVLRRNGTVDNPLPGAEDFNVADKRGLHAQALWQPAESFSADYSFDISYDGSTPLYAQATSAGSLLRAPITPLQPERADTTVVGAPQQLSVGKTHGHRLTLDWQASPTLQIKSITSYRKLNQSQFDNGSGIASAIGASANFTNVGFGRYSLAMFRQHQFSTELQAIGDLPRVKFVGGLLYYREKVEDNAQAFNTLTVSNAAGTAYSVLTIDPATQRIDRASRVTTDSLGAFGQMTWTPPVGDDILHLTLGARYTHDKKAGELFIVNNAVPNVDGVIAPRGLQASWSRFDPLVNLAFDASRDVHFYGKWSTGYKSGGANSRSLRYAPFNPETVSMFEVGAKTEFWDKRARFNVAAYAGTYKAIQLDFSAQYQQIVNGVLLTTTRTTTETTNAPGTGKMRGIEADFTLAPMPGLTLSASYAYSKVTIPATVNPFPQANGAFITVPIPIYAIYTPEHAASGAIDYEVPLAGARLVAHLDANYDSGYFANYTDPGFNTTTGAVTIAQPKGDKAFIVNGRLALADVALGANGAQFTLAAWARNLFNEQHAYYRSFSPLAGGTGLFNEPRTFGVELSVKM
ncbi:MAG: TonB-dependent receptor [Sphingomonadales bacterium]|nr:TonB-dependent receptor [Sphingomonadales bacterium]